jgi:hypothetical protein
MLHRNHWIRICLSWIQLHSAASPQLHRIHWIRIESYRLSYIQQHRLSWIQHHRPCCIATIGFAFASVGFSGIQQHRPSCIASIGFALSRIASVTFSSIASVGFSSIAPVASQPFYLHSPQPDLAAFSA